MPYHAQIDQVENGFLVSDSVDLNHYYKTLAECLKAIQRNWKRWY